ncbi:MAG: hypothetical protein LQ346_005775 [Caloplaca aetnensis]|nr:MAG: hypothetical protein LQ346_005775 [Caloplaca aetnensis]
MARPNDVFKVPSEWRRRQPVPVDEYGFPPGYGGPPMHHAPADQTAAPRVAFNPTGMTYTDTTTTSSRPSGHERQRENGRPQAHAQPVRKNTHPVDSPFWHEAALPREKEKEGLPGGRLVSNARLYMFRRANSEANKCREFAQTTLSASERQFWEDEAVRAHARAARLMA